MESKEMGFTVSDCKELAVYMWTPDAATSGDNAQHEFSAANDHWNDAARPVIHIVHGMFEHSKRYAPFAQYLVQDGYTVYAHDHRGHGRTAVVEEDKVFLQQRKAGFSEVKSSKKVTLT